MAMDRLTDKIRSWSEENFVTAFLVDLLLHLPEQLQKTAVLSPGPAWPSWSWPCLSNEKAACRV
jgi:hypothetical protein